MQQRSRHVRVGGYLTNMWRDCTITLKTRLSDEDIERAATKACRRLGYDRLKEEQLPSRTVITTWLLTITTRD